MTQHSTQIHTHIQTIKHNEPLKSAERGILRAFNYLKSNLRAQPNPLRRLFMGTERKVKSAAEHVYISLKDGATQ